MTILELHTEVRAALKHYPQYRVGQAYFSCLQDLAPELAEMVRGGPVDPFHHDERIPDFLTWLLEHLEAKPTKRTKAQQKMDKETRARALHMATCPEPWDAVKFPEHDDLAANEAHDATHPACTTCDGRPCDGSLLPMTENGCCPSCGAPFCTVCASPEAGGDPARCESHDNHQTS